jgi:AcrR family transcriptional regulator
VTTTTTTEPERQLRADARRNRERILEAASAVLAECGVDAQIDDIARRAGVGVGTVYRHFPTKEALLVELVRRKFHVFAEHAREALEQDGDPFEILAGVMRRNAATAASDVAMQHALGGVGEHIWIQAETEQRELLALTGQMLERARDGGALRRDIQPADIGMLMCGVCSTIVHTGPGFDWQRHLELAIDALRARPGG